MKRLHPILLTGLALGLLSGSAWAEIFPVFEDASGSATANSITKAGGAAKTLAVSGKSNAYMNFLVGSSGIDPGFVSAARLVIFLPKSNLKGTLSVRNLDSAFTETLATPKINAPTLGVTLEEINLEEIPLKGDYFVCDVTDAVQFWLANPQSEFGLAITSDGVASVTLASKEGAASGHAAYIEIDSYHAKGTGGIRMAAQTLDDSFAGLIAKNSEQEFFMGVQSNAVSYDGWSLFDNLAGKPRLTVDSKGYVGIGTGFPIASLHLSHQVNTTLPIDTAFFLGKSEAGLGDILTIRTFSNGGAFNLELFEGEAFKPGGGAWSVVSDRRLKKNIQPLEGALDQLLKLRSVTYEYIDPVKSHQLPGTQTGFIAQEVEEVFPEWVVENAEGFKTISIRGFESQTVEALRELRAEKDAQLQARDDRIATLEQRLSELEARDKARDAKLTAIETLLTTGNTAKVLPAVFQGDSGAE